MFNKKNENQIVFASVLLLIALLLAACQPMETSNDSADLEASISLDNLGSDVSRDQGNLVMQGTEENDLDRAMEAWAANLNAQAEAYLKRDMTSLDQALMPEIVIHHEEAIDGMEQAQMPGITVQHLNLSNGKEKLGSEFFPDGIALSQELVSETVTVYQVISDGKGWLVFHADENGKPGEIINYVHVSDGINIFVSIEALGEITEPVHAMLHVDHRISGRMEYPAGPDSPVYVEGQIVSEPISGVFD